ncbi:ABC transporter substrate-binding protein [Sandaracinobacteroides hominis]|uniref:ABC transporter substrate-binding protein n=1 Tax=Sandaracinobacteroides hominis TaxID=2780086 RepID=UPI0018F6C07B|nr:ABC transporter substrate-binding protein [Sandaracinobacteroides hominis]
MSRILGLLLFLPLLLGAAPIQRPQRIVSLNLCADQYLMALADPSQIAALTIYARDPQMSAAAAKAGGLPVSRGSAEDVLALRPDLIIASPGRRRETMEQLKGRHIATLDLPSAESYADVVAQIRLVANGIGYPERGEQLIAHMAQQLARIPANAGKGAVAAYYQRRGYLTGTGTLVDDMMQRVGLRNLAAVLHKPALAQLGLEEMAIANPDYLIVETASDRIADQGTELLHHPVIASIPRLRIPQAWTVCGGPAYPAAIRSLSEQLARDSAR